MELKDVQQVYFISKEIAMYERELEKIKAAVGTRSPEMSDMPKGNTQKNMVEEYSVNIKYYEEMIEKAKARAEVEKIKIMEYVESIDDSLMRQIIFYRHILLLPWGIVAREIGGRNTADGLRMIHKRFFRKK